MYSKEFMRFLYEYQKDEFKPKTPEQKIIRFKNNRSGKLAEVLLTEKSEQSIPKKKSSKEELLECKH